MKAKDHLIIILAKRESGVLIRWILGSSPSMTVCIEEIGVIGIALLSIPYSHPLFRLRRVSPIKGEKTLLIPRHRYRLQSCAIATSSRQCRLSSQRQVNQTIKAISRNHTLTLPLPSRERQLRRDSIWTNCRSRKITCPA